MSTIIAGVVKNGVIVPNAPLPEGAAVEIHLNSSPVVPSKLAERPQEKQPRTSLADWADANAEHWGTQLNSEDVEGFTGRRF